MSPRLLENLPVDRLDLNSTVAHPLGSFNEPQATQQESWSFGHP
jgi:hypothetical protein